jgi:Tfp pilus assembly protein PilF
VLVGLDAADWQVIDPLVRAGRLPVFARLEARGRTGRLLATPPLVSPILWTTIATGRRPEDHRVLDFMVDLPGGGQASVPSTERRVSALWNLFSDAGRRVAVVGWFATWPAENVRGTIVSDRVAPQMVRAGTDLDRRAISPAAEAAALRPTLVRATDLTRADLAAYVPLTVEEYRQVRATLLGAGSRLYRDPLAHLATIVASTRTYAGMAEALLARGQPDLVLVYLEAIDSLSHRFIKDPRRGPLAIARAYRDADELIGRLASKASPDTWIVVVSDHGFYPPEAAIAEDPSNLEGPATAWHRPYGIVAAAEARDLVDAGTAAPARPRDVGTVTPLDVTPTLLHAAGLPVSREMPGRVVTALLPDEAAARPVVRVDTLEQRRPAVAAPLTPDPDTRERLQALGYIGATTTSLARLNLGEILYRRGDLPGAERELRAVVEAQPGNVAALLWLAKAVRDQGRPRSALDLYARALALPGDNGDALVEAVDLAASAHRAEDARRLLAGHGGKAQSGPATAVARAIVARMDGRGDVAERELRAAVAADPTYLPALERLLDLLIAAGRPHEAVAPLQRAADAASGSPRHQALLGLALLASGDPAGAESRLDRALRLAPDGASVRVDLARAQLAQGKADAALATLAPAPSSVERRILQGAARAKKGQWAEAAGEYEAALDKGTPTPELLNGLAWARIQLGQRAEAARLLARSLALQKDQPEIRRLLAQIEREER